MKAISREHLALLGAAVQARNRIRELLPRLPGEFRDDLGRVVDSLSAALKARARRRPDPEPLPWNLTRETEARNAR